MRTHPKIFEINKELESEVNLYCTKFREHLISLNDIKEIIISKDTIKIDGNVYDIPSIYNITPLDYSRYFDLNYEKRQIKNHTQYSVDINDVDWSLLPNYARELHMDKDLSWTVSSGGMLPNKQNTWVKYTADIKFDFLDSLDLPFYINPVNDWTICYRNGSSTKKHKDIFVNDIVADVHMSDACKKYKT